MMMNNESKNFITNFDNFLSSYKNDLNYLVKDRNNNVYYSRKFY